MLKEPKEGLQLRCLSYNRADKVVSICLDLDLVAEAELFTESRDKLFDAIVLYLQYVIENGEFDKLIPRRAPLKYYVIYYSTLILSKTGKKRRGFLEKFYSLHSYLFPVHLNPAEGTPLFE